MTDDYDQFTKRMTSFDMVLGDESPMAHSNDPADDFLAHYGVKGMKWGVRKSSSERAEAAEAKKAKKAEKIEAKKVARKEAWKKPVDEDAAVAGQSRKRTETHGTDALSNKELQALVTRMNLEQQYTNLQSSGKAKSARQAGQEYVSDILKDTGRELASEAIKWAAREVVKTAFTKATSDTGGSRTTNATRVSPLAIESRRRLGR